MGTSLHLLFQFQVFWFLFLHVIDLAQSQINMNPPPSLYYQSWWMRLFLRNCY